MAQQIETMARKIISETEEETLRRLLTTNYERVIEVLKRSIELHDAMTDPKKRLAIDIDECLRRTRTVATRLCLQTTQELELTLKWRPTQETINRCVETLTTKLSKHCEALSATLETKQKT